MESLLKGTSFFYRLEWVSAAIESANTREKVVNVKDSGRTEDDADAIRVTRPA